MVMGWSTSLVCLGPFFNAGGLAGLWNHSNHFHRGNFRVISDQSLSPRGSDHHHFYGNSGRREIDRSQHIGSQNRKLKHQGGPNFNYASIELIGKDQE